MSTGHGQQRCMLASQRYVGEVLGKTDRVMRKSGAALALALVSNAPDEAGIGSRTSLEVVNLARPPIEVSNPYGP